MIIQSKFRDIPFEEARRCYRDDSILTAENWARLQTAPLLIETPSATGPAPGFTCSGPFYLASVEYGELSAHKPGIRIAVCPHIAEIGD